MCNSSRGFLISITGVFCIQVNIQRISTYELESGGVGLSISKCSKF